MKNAVTTMMMMMMNSKIFLMKGTTLGNTTTSIRNEGTKRTEIEVLELAHLND